MLSLALSIGLWLQDGDAASLRYPEDAAGEWRRVLPPANTNDFAPVYDERREVWVLAGMGGSATRGEVWTSSSHAAGWTRAEAANRIAPGFFVTFTAWDDPADRIVSLLSADDWSPARPLVAWECTRGTGDTWRVLEATGEAPPHRLVPNVAYDPVGRRLFVLGGRGRDNQVIDDGLWILSLAPTPRWTRVVTEGPAPRSRMRAGVAFDPVRQVLVLYGGEVLTESGGGIRTDAEDVWFLDLAAEPPSWRRVAETSPGPGWGLSSSVVSDPARDRVLTFGGTMQADGVWEMSMATPGAWRPVGSGAPRTIAGTIGRDRGGDAVVFLSPLRARWRFDLATATWTRIDSGSSELPRLFDAALTLDPRDGSVLALGVRELPSTHAGPVDVEPRLTRFVPGDIGHWEPVIAAGDPPPRIAGTAVWDSRRRRWVVLGGYDAHADAPASTWVLETEPSLAWRPLDAEGMGPIGEHLPALYDRERDRLVVLEEDPATRGMTLDANSRLRVWTLTLDGPVRWNLEEIPGRVPTGRFGAALALDRRRDRMLVFGGSRYIAGVSQFHRGYDDIWALDLGLSLPWQEVLSRVNFLPQSVDAGADVDAWNDRLELIGGGRSPGSRLQLDFMGPYERDSVRTLDLATNTRGSTGTPTGFQGIPWGRTVVDPVTGRAFHFAFGTPDAWEWSTQPKHEVRVAIGHHGSAGAGDARLGHGALELVVHGDDRFDPADIDLATVRAGGLAALASPGGRGGRGDDVDGDGFADRRFLFAASGTGEKEPVEFRALTVAGVPVIGFARPAMGDRHDLNHVAVGALVQALSSVRPVSVRLVGGRGQNSSSHLIVEGGESPLLSVQVYDVRGRLLGSAQRRRTPGEATSLDLPETTRAGPGITFVRVQVGDEIRVVRSIRLD